MDNCKDCGKPADYKCDNCDEFVCEECSICDYKREQSLCKDCHDFLEDR